MKSAFYFSLICLIAACNSGGQNDANTVTRDESVLDEATLEALCITQSKPIKSSEGKFISAKEASRKLYDYKHFRRTVIQNPENYRDSTDIYGFAFGIKKLRQMLDSIDAYNAKIKLPADSLVAVRVYMARSFNRLANKEIADVFLAPLRHDASNIYDIDSLTDFHSKPFVANKNINEPEPLILNASRPCPTLCSKKSAQ